ncbi:retinoic acid early-inducible protein 1-gamma-like, partial [Arvicanthis niloticus]|uniref:retinoic acid early-inducible protein 1-gamma-like n=1 Tax=Arvicanthis niloticus TaxID=61156 RepID=UPI00402B2D69
MGGGTLASFSVIKLIPASLRIWALLLYGAVGKSLPRDDFLRPDGTSNSLKPDATLSPKPLLCQDLPKQDTHFLCCNMIIKSPTSENPLWYEGQCSVDDKFSFNFNNIKKTMPLDNQGKMSNANEVKGCLTQWLNHLGQELRDKVSDIKVDTAKTSGYPTLQTTMVSQHRQGQIIGASWLLNISENYFFTLDIMNMTWIPTKFVPENIMNEWRDDVELNKHLKNSIAECSQKFNEFVKWHKESPRSTPRVPDSTQLTSTTQLPPTSHFPYMEVLIPVGIVVVLVCSFIAVYLWWNHYNQG